MKNYVRGLIKGKYLVFSLSSSLLFLIFFGCAGSVLNPYLTDMYGTKVNLVEEGAVLIEIKEDLDPDIFHFRFYENAIRSNYSVELNKNKRVYDYLAEFASKKGYKNFNELKITLQTGMMNSYWHQVRFSRSLGTNSSIITNYNNNNIMKGELTKAAIGIVNALDENINDKTNSVSLSNSPKGCHVFGKIKFVDFGEDYKVKFVEMGENLKVKYNDIDLKKSGNWKIVEFGENYKIKSVEFGEDFRVKIVELNEGCK